MCLNSIQCLNSVQFTSLRKTCPHLCIASHFWDATENLQNTDQHNSLSVLLPPSKCVTAMVVLVLPSECKLYVKYVIILLNCILMISDSFTNWHWFEFQVWRNQNFKFIYQLTSFVWVSVKNKNISSYNHI